MQVPPFDNSLPGITILTLMELIPEVHTGCALPHCHLLELSLPHGCDSLLSSFLISCEETLMS